MRSTRLDRRRIGRLAAKACRMPRADGNEPTSAFATTAYQTRAIGMATQDSSDDAAAARPLFHPSGHDASRGARDWGCPIPAVSPPAAALLLCCLQDPIGWLASAGCIEPGWRARGRLARLPRIGRPARFESLGSSCHPGGSVPPTDSVWRVSLGCVARRRVAGGWPRGLRRRLRLAGGRVGPSQLRSGVVGRASPR